MVSVFFAVLVMIHAEGVPSLTEVRGPVYAEELARCLPTDMYQLISDTLDTMENMTSEKAPGTAFPIDKLGWFAQTLTKLMTGGRDFCEAYAMTTSMAISRFSDHLLRSPPLSQHRMACQSRLAASSNPYTRNLGHQNWPSSPTVANDPLVKCLMVGSFAVEQLRLAEPSRPEKKKK
jgi:hypothetical protein